MPEIAPGPTVLDYVPRIREFFDRHYAAHDRYWWRGENRYSTEPTEHTRFNAVVLAEAARRGPGLALDLGAGEGADSIRLARLGYQVDAVELSAVACEKIERFARAEGVTITIRNEPVETAQLPAGRYDAVLMNGCLHYVRDKAGVLRRAEAASAGDALHAVALFSTATPVPPEHDEVPVFPDDEDGTVERFYRDWRSVYRAYERGRDEHSHPGFGPHAHSHIKLVQQRRPVKEKSL
ncbi:MAG: class I SAM-dependent methyltransferase [Streptosporangiales bacterium]|nr:class I SAM-dependent methyltransferase [Streptosporangiales bacterium]